MGEIIYYAFPAFVALLLVEAAWLRRARRLAASEPAGPDDGLRGYRRADTWASLAMGGGNVAITAAVHGGLLVVYTWLWEHRLFEIGTGATAFVLLFVAEDFTYYWWHRVSHEVRLLWAAHENHHSSEYFNYSTALRQSYTTPFTVPLFYWWLPLAGFHPVMIFTQISLSLIYQFWIHTELVDRLPGPVEWLLNTPSHHRVHHGANVEYLDRNHGGILIVWDRLFGTFEPERVRVRYGLTHPLRSFDPLRIAFHEWIDMLRAVRRPAPWRPRLGYLFAPPGWSPDGSSLTARQLRARARQVAWGASALS
jgi:sterol desaturase/sphingolipid hydroxylase (fatty acid hydroxylase superfamily)